MEVPQKVGDVLHARWVIPVVPDGVYLENHSVVINEGRILDILPIEEAKRKYVSDTEHPFEDHHVLLPGLINMHSHAAMTLLRGFADDVSLSDWLQNYIWPAEGKWVSEEFVEDGTKIAVAEMIRCGVTCFNDMYHFPHVTAKVASEYGMRSCIGIPVLMFPSNWAANTNDYVEKGKAHLYETYKNHPLVTVTVAPHAPYTVDNDGFNLVKKTAEELNLRIHTHLHETEFEVVEHVKNHEGKRPIQRLDELGLITPSLIAVHMTQLTEEEIKLISTKGASVVHCPESNLKLVSGTCPVAKLIEAGTNVALGTDSAASNDDLDLFGELRTASLLDKLQAHDATALPAWQMLKIATLNGAKAMGLEKDLGSLEKGKLADIVAIKLRTEPVYNPITNLVYVGTNTVTDVWVAGKPLLRGGEFTSIDEAAIMKKAKEWGARIKSWKAEQSGKN